MPGAPDPLYVAARGVLLDALAAVREQLDALVLVGVPNHVPFKGAEPARDERSHD